MFGSEQGEGRSSLLSYTLKSVAAVAILSCLAANWLSTTSSDRETLSRLAFNASRGFDDPLTTGSLGRANSTRLDPCSLPARRP